MGALVDIDFSSNRLAALCNTRRLAIKEWGEPRAKRVRLRLDQLHAAPTLDAMRGAPGRCHELTGDLAGRLSVDLDGPYRLLFEPLEDPAPLKNDGGLDWRGVTGIRILMIDDTHG
jgi:proteic killer suppression protein